MPVNPIFRTPAALAAALLLAACGAASDSADSAAIDSTAAAPVVTIEPEAAEQPYLANLRQLTFGGENAEAYWSANGQYITFQSTRDGRTCDQQYVMRADGSDVKQISVGGKTTCGFFYNNDSRVFFAATHHADSACPPRPDPSQGYVWPLDKYDIYTAILTALICSASLATASTPPRACSRPMESRSCSRPRRTAISTSTP